MPVLGRSFRRQGSLGSCDSALPGNSVERRVSSFKKNTHHTVRPSHYSRSGRTLSACSRTWAAGSARAPRRTRRAARCAAGRRGSPRWRRDTRRASLWLGARAAAGPAKAQGTAPLTHTAARTARPWRLARPCLPPPGHRVAAEAGLASHVQAQATVCHPWRRHPRVRAEQLAQGAAVRAYDAVRRLGGVRVRVSVRAGVGSAKEMPPITCSVISTSALTLRAEAPASPQSG